MDAWLRSDAQGVDTGPRRPRAESAGLPRRGRRLTAQFGARLGLEIRLRGQALSRDRAAAHKANPGMDATLRRTARRNDTGPSRPQTDARPGVSPGIQLA